MSTRTLVASSVFAGTEDPLSEGGNWAVVESFSGHLKKTSGLVLGSSSTSGADRWSGAGSFNISQYASLKLSNGGASDANTQIGVYINASTDTDSNADYYAYYLNEKLFGGVSGDSRVTKLVKVVNGAETVIASSTIAWSTNDLIEIEYDATGGTLYGMKNGAVIVSGAASGLSLGAPGLRICNEWTSNYWEGGNVSFAPPGGLLVPSSSGGLKGLGGNLQS